MDKITTYVGVKQTDLPIGKPPKLSDCIGLFLGAVKPVLNINEYGLLNNLAEDFSRPGGEGEKLQFLLQKKSNSATNWLTYYRTKAKLADRDPLHVNKNVGYAMLERLSENEDQITVAAKWIIGTLAFRRAILENSLTVERVGRTPMCMALYNFLFDSYRMPGWDRDKACSVPARHAHQIKHVCVMHNGRIFVVRVLNDAGQIITRKRLEGQLRHIVERSSAQDTTPIGLFTTLPRSEWYDVYRNMCKSNQNASSLKDIKRAMFMVCLDNEINVSGSSETIFANQVHDGAGLQHNSGNRWYDKSIQFIITHDGRVGVNYEHGIIDGTQVSSMIRHIYAAVQNECVMNEVHTPGFPDPRQLQFELSPKASTALCDAMVNFNNTICDMDVVAFKFDDYGKEFAKGHKLSMDALLQIAYQLAYYRLTGKLTMVSETCSVRKFALGRVDHMRTSTELSASFCRAMDDVTANQQAKRSLLEIACTLHRQSIERTMDGSESIDQLFALEWMAKEAKMPLHPLFQSDLYKDYKRTNVLWTSGLACEYDTIRVQGMRYADGMASHGAIFYSAMPYFVRFSVTASKSQHSYDSLSFAKEISIALQNIATLLNEAASPA